MTRGKADRGGSCVEGKVLLQLCKLYGVRMLTITSSKLGAIVSRFDVGIGIDYRNPDYHKHLRQNGEDKPYAHATETCLIQRPKGG